MESTDSEWLSHLFLSFPFPDPPQSRISRQLPSYFNSCEARFGGLLLVPVTGLEVVCQEIQQELWCFFSVRL